MSLPVTICTVAFAVITLFAAGGTDLRIDTGLLVVALLAFAWTAASGNQVSVGSSASRRLAFWAGLYFAVNVLSLVWSVYRQGTVIFLLNLTLSVVLFALVLTGLRGREAARLWGGVALVGLLACGYALVEYLVTPGGFIPMVRLDGTFTYPNAFAAFAGFFLCLFVGWEGCWPWSDAAWPPWFRTLGGAVAAAALAGAGSRGLFLVLPLALAATLWGPAGAWRPGLRRLAASSLAGVLLLAGFVMAKPAVTGEPFSLSAALSVWGQRLELWQPAGGGGEPGSDGTGQSGAGAPERPGTDQSVGPEEGGFQQPGVSETGITSLTERLSVGPGGRLAFWRAALTIGRDYPLGGAGAGTFARLHSAYQVSPKYYASEAHSQYLQTWAETGLAGVIAWLALIAAGVGAVLEARRRPNDSGREQPLSGNRPGLVRSLRGGLLLLLVHSAIDLDFSVPAVQVLFWLALGVVAVLAGSEETFKPGRKKTAASSSRGRRSPRGPALAGAALILAVLAVFPVASLGLANSGYRLIASGQPRAGFDRLLLAQKLNPLDPAPHVYLGRLAGAAARNSGDRDLFGAAVRQFEAAQALDPKNPDRLSEKAAILAVAGDLEGAIQAARQAASLAPYVPAYHRRLAELYVKRGDDGQALTVLRGVIVWWDDLLLGVPSEAREDATSQGEAIFALAAEAAHRLGDDTSARAYAEKALALNPSSERAAALLRSLGPR